MTQEPTDCHPQEALEDSGFTKEIRNAQACAGIFEELSGTFLPEADEMLSWDWLSSMVPVETAGLWTGRAQGVTPNCQSQSRHNYHNRQQGWNGSRSLDPQKSVVMVSRL